MKDQVLVFSGIYIPGVKGGGPIQSIKNIVETLSGKIDFYIITNDRDLGDKSPFTSVKTGAWNRIGRASVYYLDKNFKLREFIKEINSINYSVIYLNSFFSVRFSMIPIMLIKLGIIAKGKKIILAPRGEFSRGALSLKYIKKMLFIRIARILGIYRGIQWHATSEYERQDIVNLFGENQVITIATNLISTFKKMEFGKEFQKIPGVLECVSVSRIHPMKNLLQTLLTLRQLNGEVKFYIYGPIEDQEYWEKCTELIQDMPSNIHIAYEGIINNCHLQELYYHQHFFVLLTLGENFGHAIAEALLGGCPVLISNRTPWRNLESLGIGWDVPLEDMGLVLKIFQKMVDMDNREYQSMAQQSFSYIKQTQNCESEIKAYYKMFRG